VVYSSEIVSKWDAYGIIFDGGVGGYINEKKVAYSLPINTWSHIAMSYNGSEQRLYINGTLVATRIFSEAITLNPNSLIIGSGFSGIIDELKIFNVTLTADEIRAEYLREKFNLHI